MLLRSPWALPRSLAWGGSSVVWMSIWVRMLPINGISCSGADSLQIHRSHCTRTAKGNGNASRLGCGIAAAASSHARSVLPGSSSHLVQVVGLSQSARMDAACQSPFGPERRLLLQLSSFARSVLPGSSSHLVQVVGLSQSARMDAACQSPFGPERRFLKVLPKCPS